MAQIIVKMPLTFLLNAQKKFTSLQKCILLGLCTLVWGVFSSWWWPALVFLGSLPLSWIVSRKILSGSNNPALPCILKSYKVILERAQYVLQMLSPSKPDILEKESFIKLDNTLPEVEVRETLHFIHRDFVKSWYSLISDEEEFLDEVMQILEELSMSLFDRVKQIDIRRTVPDYVVLVRKHILDYQEAMKHLNTQPNVRRKKDRTKEFKKVNNVVDSFIRLGKCHIAVKNDRELEFLYLRVIVESLLKILIPEDLLRCSPGKDLILEILTCQVLGNFVEMFCEPEFLHKVMVLLLSDEELDYLEKPNTHTNAVSDSLDSSNCLHALPSYNLLLDEQALTSSPLASNSATLDCPANVAPEAAIAETCENPVIFISSHHLSNSRPTQEEEMSPLSDYATDQSQTEASVYSSEETLVKVLVVTEPSQNASQTLYVSDALAKQFKVSVSNVDKVKVIDALENQDKSSVSSSLSDDVAKKSLSGKLSLLNLNGHLTSDDEDTSVDASEDFAFTPSFFVPNDDNISISSELSGEQNLTPEGSLRSDSGRDSRSLSPASAKSETESIHERNRNLGKGLNVSDRALRTLDATDNSPVTSTTTDIAQQLFPSCTVDGMVRTTSCSDLLITQRTQPGSQDTHTTGLRKVASFNTLHEKSNRINHPTNLSTVSLSSNTGARLPQSLTSHRPSLPAEIHPQSSNIPRQMQNSIGVVNEATTDGPVEATSQDMPDDLFMNVQIYAAEKIRDPSGSMYTIYLIKYRAWHLEADTWCLRSGHAHRRYREFVTLHDRLEEHPIYKKKIRDVKGPQRWKVLPFGQIEMHGIEARRKFLEGYLQTLITREQVGNSLAIREFLAYEGDARIAFVKKASEVPRIDKMIAKTFSGVMNKLTTRSPPKFSDNSVQRKAKASRSRGEAGPMKKDIKDGGPGDLEDQDALMLDYTYSHSDQDAPVQTMENILSRHVHAMVEPQVPAVHSATDTPADSEGDSDSDGFKDVIEEDEPSVSLDTPVTETQDHDTHIPLVARIVDLAVELVKGRNPWVVRNNVITSLKVAAGEELERLLHAEIAELTTEEECARYISLLRELLWPCGQLDTEPTRPLTDKERAGARRQARSCLAAFLPGVLPIVVGQEDFDAALDHIMEVIDHPTLNRHLVYSLLDAALQTVFPEVCTLTLQQQLISTSGQ